MPKLKTRWVCQQCNASFPKWNGRCTECGEWNSLVETVVDESRQARSKTIFTGVGNGNQPERLGDIAADSLTRVELPIEEFNRVLGGGIVPGSLVLIGGDPGIGKSTLLLEVSARMAQLMKPVLYVSGEESARQVKLRADRLGVNADDLYLLSETNLNAIIDQARQLRPRLLVVDSIQAVYLEELESTAGSVSQVRESAARLMHLAKGDNIPVFVVGHVTKAGAIAGPRILEHTVDTVLYLEGERFHSYRLLRSVKNRFGSTDEVGVFEMRREGLVEVANPSEAFLAERMVAVPGSTVAVTVEGTRPLLVEVQALTTATASQVPRRTANGIDLNRLLLLTAVLSKRVGLKLAVQDVFVNVVGGLRITEPAVDLSVAVALASSQRGAPVTPDLAVFGEVGLSGELRSVGHTEKRLNEAAKLGFKRVLMPRHPRNSELNTPNGLQVLEARSVGEALDMALQPVRPPAERVSAAEPQSIHDRLR